MLTSSSATRKNNARVLRPASLIRQLGHSAAPLAFLASLAWGCANPGTPTGGPRDRKPPVMISSMPAPGATDFKGKVVTIIFDENVQLKEADKKFVMSPPTAAPPTTTTGI